jgi:O-antigen ligase
MGWSSQVQSGATSLPAPTVPVFWRGAPWLAVALIAVVVGRVQEVFPALEKFRLALVGSAAVILVLFVKANAPTWRSVSRSATSRLLVAYTAWLAITVPFAVWPGLAFATTWTMLPLVVMYVSIVMCCPSWANLDKVQLGFVIALTAFAAGSLLRGAQIVGGRLSPLGIMYDPNDMAAVLAVGFALAAGLASRARGVPRLVMVVAALILATGVLASASRGGALALAVGGAVFVAGQRGRRLTIYLAASALGVIVAWQGGGPVFRERLATLLEVGSDYNVQESTGRLAIWKRGVTYFVSHPILGVGAGNFEAADGVSVEMSGEHRKWTASHNAYLQAFVDSGVVGGVLFLAVIGVTASRARRLWRPRVSRDSARIHRPELLAALSAFCVAALFLSLAYSGILVVLVGLTALATGAARADSPRVWHAGSVVDRASFSPRAV